MVRKIYPEAKYTGSYEREIMLTTGAPMYVSCRTHGRDTNKQIKGRCIRGRQWDRKERRRRKEGGLKEARRFKREPTCLSAGSDMLTTPSASSLMDCRI
jgi:hypothetical protein